MEKKWEDSPTPSVMIVYINIQCIYLYIADLLRKLAVVLKKEAVHVISQFGNGKKALLEDLKIDEETESLTPKFMLLDWI